MSREKPCIALIATLDTKAAEIDYVRSVLARYGADAIIIDSGVLGTPGIAADVPREEVARWAGHSLKEVQDSGSRGSAIAMMQNGLRQGVRALFDAGRFDGILCLGGAEGALLGAAAMHALPLGVPKVIVSPSASGRREFGPFMGSSDVLVMHSVIDILGLNSVARTVFENAAAAVYGMCALAGRKAESDRPCVGMTMLGQTTPGAMVVASDLEAAGYEPIIFHANGVGGPAMDQMARDGLLAGVIDFTLSEVVNSLFDGLHATSEDRMRAAVQAGLPLVVVPGAGDFFNQGPMESVPSRYRDRQLYHHNPVATLVRVREDEMRDFAREVAKRINSATAPTEVIIPRGGLSLIGVPGGPIADEAADKAFGDELKTRLDPKITLTTADMPINDQLFGHLVARRFLDLTASAKPSAEPFRAADRE